MMTLLKIVGAVLAWLTGLAVLGYVLDVARGFFGHNKHRKGRCE